MERLSCRLTTESRSPSCAKRLITFYYAKTQKGLRDLCLPLKHPPPLAHKATRHLETMHCCVLQCKGLKKCKCQTDLFLLLFPRRNGFSNMDRNFVHQKDAAIQHWICQPITGVAGCCSMDVSVLAQPISAHLSSMWTLQSRLE